MILLTAVTVLAADQVTKAMVRAWLPRGKSVDLRLFRLRQVRNPGSAFGLIQGQSLPFFVAGIAVLFLFLAALWRWKGFHGKAFHVSLGLIMAGAVGNIIDRIFLGEVVDFIDLRFWPVFNLADLAMVVGVATALFFIVKGMRRREHPAGN